jgi:hypothetical protein
MKLRKTDASANVLLKAIAERQDALERQLDTLATAVQSLEKRLAERSEEPDFSVQEGTVEVLAASEAGAAQGKKPGMKAEVRAVIAAAAAVAGEMGRVRRVRALPAAQDAGSAWSQQGRLRVVSSHQLR